MQKKVNILLSGGSGFLGSNLVNYLYKNKKYNLYLLKRSGSNFSRINKNIFKRLNFIQYPNRNLAKIFKAKKIDCVIHCATNYGSRKNTISEIIQPNLILPMQLLDLCYLNNVRCFLNTDTVLDKRVSNYSLSKNQFSEWLRHYSKNFACSNIKIEHFFGPGDNETKFVISTIKSFLNNEKNLNFTLGTQKRDFIFIDDVVSAMDKILTYSLKKKIGYDLFEVGTGKNVSIKNIVKMIKKICKNTKSKLNFGKIPMRKNELLKVNLNLKKLKALKWKPIYHLENSLKRTIDYYKKNK